MIYLWFDPPSGWKYDFPCLIVKGETMEEVDKLSKEFDFDKLYDEHNYPQHLRELNQCRMWYESDTGRLLDEKQ